MNFITSVMMEGSFIISGLRKKNRLVIHKTFEVYGCSDCSGCRHKEKCLYKYDAEKDAEKNIIRERIPDMIDCAIVIGGDGSLIEVARTLWEKDVPILGINMGTLGYLTEVEVSNLAEDITQMLKGDYLYEEQIGRAHV